MEPGTEVSVLVAVSRLLAATTEGDADDIHATIVGEACECFGAAGAVLIAQEPGRRVRVLGGAAPTERGLDDHPLLAEMLDRRLRLVRPDAERMHELDGLTGERRGSGLLLLLRSVDRLDGALLLHEHPARAMSAVDGEVATAFADAAAAALDRLRAVEEQARIAHQQQALTRAAKSLNESLDLETVLARICAEAVTVMGADVAVVYRGSRQDPLVLTAGHGVPPEAIGWEMPLGAGLAGKVVVHGRAMLTNDYRRIAELPADAPLPPTITSAMSAPMEWDGALRGVLTVGYAESRPMTQADLALLETVAELAASACANASAHAEMAHVARTDGLTGCLNHAALHDGLAKEIERALRHDQPLSLILIDLDDFKQINEVHGHLVGDEVLRRAGHALRHAMRPYDLAARYGGDEFALVAVDADEDTAADMAERALARLQEAIEDLLPEGGTPGTAGIAQWSAGASATELVARADRALLYAKQEGFRGRVHTFGGVPSHFRPGRFSREDRGLPDPPPMPDLQRDWPESRLDERLRKRTRQLALANELGARIAAMTRAPEIYDATVEELHRAFGYFHASILHLRDERVESVAVRGPGDVAWVQPADQGLVGRCLRTRRPVLANDVQAEADYRSTEATEQTRSELVVPAVGRRRAVRRDRRRAGRARRLRPGRRAAAGDGRVAARLGTARRVPLRAARARVSGDRGGARRGAGGQGRLHSRPRALDRRPGRGGRPPARGLRGRPVATCASPRSSTTSARSRSPRRSCTSPARCRPPSAR